MVETRIVMSAFDVLSASFKDFTRSVIIALDVRSVSVIDLQCI